MLYCRYCDKILVILYLFIEIVLIIINKNKNKMEKCVDCVVCKDNNFV